jgi:hypothetical protein
LWLGFGFEKTRELPVMFCDDLRQHAAGFLNEDRILPTASYSIAALGTIRISFGRKNGF